MSSTTVPAPLRSPGLANGRRKNPPKLPLSAFSPPNTGTSDTFPLPPTPSAVVPVGVVDSHLRVSASPASIDQYKENVGQLTLEKITAVVLTIDSQRSNDIPSLLQGLRSYIDLPILSVSVPFELDQAPPSEPLSCLSGTNPPTTLSTAFTRVTPEAVASLTWALDHSAVVDIDVQSDVMGSTAISGPTLYDFFEDLLTKATAPPAGADAAEKKRTPIVLSNVFPPPLDFHQPIVKVMKQPDYLQYQSRVSSLSLFENLYLKITPPVRETPGSESTVHLKEWKGRLKLYIGPVLEAFGFERMIFGTSSSPAGEAFDLPVSWYDLVRESFAELGVEQDAIDNVFMNNAKRVYGRPL